MSDTDQNKTPAAASAEAPVIVYTAAGCGYCASAKRLLQRLEVRFAEVDLTNNWELRERLSNENDGYRMVPMIYVGGSFVGGYDQLDAIARRGGLKHLQQR